MRKPYRASPRCRFIKLKMAERFAISLNVANAAANPDHPILGDGYSISIINPCWETIQLSIFIVKAPISRVYVISIDFNNHPINIKDVTCCVIDVLLSGQVRGASRGKAPKHCFLDRVLSKRLSEGLLIY